MHTTTPHQIRDLGTEPLQPRPDAAAKLSGNPGFLTDRIQASQLRGAILGSPHPHARIVRIDTSTATALPGVHAVVTHADIPGIKHYGLRKVDRPVLCIDKVRHVGDPVAAVAAIDLASISATEASCPAFGFEPSLFGKFRVVCLMLRLLLAGVSHAPKQGPQKAVLTVAPAVIRSSRVPFSTSSIFMGWLPG